MSCIPAQTTHCACTYTFSDWGACQPDAILGGIQRRTVLTSEPVRCIGVPSLWRTCTPAAPVAPPPALPAFLQPPATCVQTISYATNAPAEAVIAKDVNPACDAAGLEIAAVVLLAKLFGLK